ncbi:MAG: c-type cytochrome [Anaerolineae bacterium]|jgi:mono/diheme cytochrome c family protein|nr:c-type cytochrome [Anaerolineae bacterium]
MARYKYPIFFVIALTLIGVGYILAQTATPTIPADFECSQAELIFVQYDFQVALDTFDEQYLQSPDTALALLYDTGKAYQQLALKCGYLPPDFASLAAGTDMAIIMNALNDLQGDPIRGQAIYNNLELSGTADQVACAGCHESEGGTAPLTEGTWTRWDEIHRLEPQFEGYTFAQYIVESIIYPNAYIAEPYAEGVMPIDFGEKLTLQDLADIITFLESQDQLLD